MKVCKYYLDKECFNKFDECGQCGKNPHRFDNREITPGQISLLKRLGVSEEEISSMTFKTARKKLNSLLK